MVSPAILPVRSQGLVDVPLLDLDFGAPALPNRRVKLLGRLFRPACLVIGVCCEYHEGGHALRLSLFNSQTIGHLTAPCERAGENPGGKGGKPPGQTERSAARTVDRSARPATGVILITQRQTRYSVPAAIR